MSATPSWPGLRDGRPPLDDPHVFLCMRPPWRPLGTAARVVAHIVARALDRAGTDRRLPSRGAHLLRHSVARGLIEDGATLETVAALLRHRSIETTSIYAKADYGRLHEIAQPWPGGASMIVDAVDRYIAFDPRRRRPLPPQTLACLVNYAAFAQDRGEMPRQDTDRPRMGGAVVYQPSRSSHSRLLVVRRFALAVSAGGSSTRSAGGRPPVSACPGCVPSPTSTAPDEIASLLAVADECSSIGCLVPGQYRTLFGLIAATGLRRCEALALDIGDITSEGMMVRPTKRAGRRLLPLHPTLETELIQHLGRRARVPAGTEALFLGVRRRRLAQSTTLAVFHRMLARTGLTGAASGGRNPRIHDFRHTFAVRSLESCGSDRWAIDRHIVCAQRLARPCLSHPHLLVHPEHRDASGTDCAAVGNLPRGGRVMTALAGHMSALSARVPPP